MTTSDTIFALSSGAPPAAIGIIRISGPSAFAAAGQLTERLPPPRVAALRALLDPRDGTLLDRALVLVFPGPASATGEDLVELHVHGGRAVVAAIERALAAIPNLRQAEPGEFTRRAMLSGRIDLTEAEGLGDLLMAETESQRRMAMLVTEGGARRRIEDWTNRAVALAAEIEAQLDFSDEDDVPAQNVESVRAALGALAVDMSGALAEPPIEKLRDGIRVAIGGPPNSGKSTLVNALVGRDVAIVTPIAGTTRDVIEVPVARNGVAYLVFDTAGIREAHENSVEAIGIARASTIIASADVLLWLGDDPPPQDGAIWVHSRADIVGRQALPPGKAIALSAVTGTGLNALWSIIEIAAGALLPSLDRAALNVRQRNLLSGAYDALRLATHESDLLIMAEQVGQCRRALDAITGRADTEAVLDSIFARFLHWQIMFHVERFYPS